MRSGIFILSLDFELLYGMKEKATKESYGRYILGGRTAIIRLLELFQSYGIHATWATVGMLFAKNKKELLSLLPKNQPQYKFPELSSYKYIKDIGEDENEDPYHYAYSIIQNIRRIPNQEIATHTFSHYYTEEKGQNYEQFAEDLAASMNAFRAADVESPKSIVFPRNQVNKEYATLLKQVGIICYRGNERQYSQGGSNLFIRGLRLLDTWFNLFGHCCYLPSNSFDPIGLCNARSSRFFRAFKPGNAFLEKRKISRIKSQMLHAAKYGKVFHIWWHPHNIGLYTEENLKQLEDIFNHFIKLKAMYGFESLNMGEFAQEVLNENCDVGR